MVPWCPATALCRLENPRRAAQLSLVACRAIYSAHSATYSWLAVVFKVGGLLVLGVELGPPIHELVGVEIIGFRLLVICDATKIRAPAWVPRGLANCAQVLIYKDEFFGLRESKAVS